jgi:phosphate-selective porin OprO/OprP
VIDPEDNALDFEDQSEMRGGVSYYFDQHNLKLQADIGNLHTARKGRADIDDLEVRTQLQLIF